MSPRTASNATEWDAIEKRVADEVKFWIQPSGMLYLKHSSGKWATLRMASEYEQGAWDALVAARLKLAGVADSLRGEEAFDGNLDTAVESLIEQRDSYKQRAESVSLKLAAADRLVEAARKMEVAYHSELISLAARFVRGEFVLNLEDVREIREARRRRERQNEQHIAFSRVVKNGADEIRNTWRSALLEYQNTKV